MSRKTLKIQQFNRCLTNGMDYFIAGDPYALLDFKKRNNLSDNLLAEFTTNESGDNVVYEGIMNCVDIQIYFKIFPN